MYKCSDRSYVMFSCQPSCFSSDKENCITDTSRDSTLFSHTFLHGQTDMVTPWAPVGTQNITSCLNTHGGEDVGHAYRMVDVRSLLRITPPLILVLDGGEVGGLDDHTGCVGHFIRIFI